jgi:hypothetical protein
MAVEEHALHFCFSTSCLGEGGQYTTDSRDRNRRKIDKADKGKQWRPGDASNARFWRLSLSHGAPFQMLAFDGRYLAAPLPSDSYASLRHHTTGRRAA